MRHYYAYGVMVGGRKVTSGCLHADSLEDAAIRAAKVSNLVVDRSPATHGADYIEWTRDGKRASLCVWIPPELLEGKLSKEQSTKSPSHEDPFIKGFEEGRALRNQVTQDRHTNFFKQHEYINDATRHGHWINVETMYQAFKSRMESER